MILERKSHKITKNELDILKSGNPSNINSTPKAKILHDTGPQSLPTLVEQFRRSPKEKAWPSHQSFKDDQWKYSPIHETTTRTTHTFGDKVSKQKYTDI